MKNQEKKKNSKFKSYNKINHEFNFADTVIDVPIICSVFLPGNCIEKQSF